MVKRRRLNYDDIREALPTLTDEQLGEVKSACSLLGAVGPGNKPNTVIRSIHEEDEKFLLFYDVFAEIMRGNVGTRLPKSSTHLPGELYKNLKSGWAIVDDLLKQAMPRARLTHRTKFYRIVMMSVIEHIQNLGIILSTKTVTQQLKNSPAVLHQQFPGYLKSGLLALTLRWNQAEPNADDEEL